MVRAPIAAVCAAIVALPVVAAAQSEPSSFNYYHEPKILKLGSPKSAIPGPGTVVVKVLVNKDGTFKVQGIIHSTNHADDQAAIEIAESSVYKPATRGSTKETAFKDFTLKLAAGGASNGEEDLPALEQYRRMIESGNASGAKSNLVTYIGSHPDDAKAELYLGLAEDRLNAPKDAVAAFSKAGTIPAEYHDLAAKAYADAAIDAVSGKDTAGGVDLAKKAVELSPTYDKYLVLGYANLAAGDLPASVAALEKSRDLAKSANVTPKQMSPIYSNLVQAYARSGDYANAKSAASAAKAIDPSTNVDQVLEQSFLNRGNALQNAGKMADAGAVFEEAAGTLPKSAGPFYARAALAYLAVKPDAGTAGKADPNLAKADADADKALAADPSNAAANYAKGIALANMSKGKDALEYLKKADDLAKKGTDAKLTEVIENAIKQLSGGK